MDRQLSEEIHKRRNKTGLVGLSVLALKDGEVVFSAASGERKKGSAVPVTESDKWHIGSITKSFTSTMIARLIEKEQLHWDTRVGDVFANENIDDSWRDVTLAQLLTHTSGAKANFSFYTTLYKKPEEGETLLSLRTHEVLKVLKKPPKKAPGSSFAYSNLGYTIAAAMSEKATGLEWRELVMQEVLQPLQMHSAEFGPPQSQADELQQPVGHKSIFGFKFAATPGADLSPIIAPAGLMSLTLKDLAVYANDHLQGELGFGKLLLPETYQRLHTPEMAGYGYGWVSKPAEEWSGGGMLWHNGSNGWWHALMVLLPASNTVVLVAANDGNVSAAEVNAWEIIRSVMTTLNKSGEK